MFEVLEGALFDEYLKISGAYRNAKVEAYKKVVDEHYAKATAKRKEKETNRRHEAAREATKLQDELNAEGYTRSVLDVCAERWERHKRNSAARASAWQACNRMNCIRDLADELYNSGFVGDVLQEVNAPLGATLALDGPSDDNSSASANLGLSVTDGLKTIISDFQPSEDLSFEGFVKMGASMTSSVLAGGIAFGLIPLCPMLTENLVYDACKLASGLLVGGAVRAVKRRLQNHAADRQLQALRNPDHKFLDKSGFASGLGRMMGKAAGAATIVLGGVSRSKSVSRSIGCIEDLREHLLAIVASFDEVVADLKNAEAERAKLAAEIDGTFEGTTNPPKCRGLFTNAKNKIASASAAAEQIKTLVSDYARLL